MSASLNTMGYIDSFWSMGRTWSMGQSMDQWVGPDQNRKWSRWANEYIPVPAYSHRFHYKTPEKHSLIDKYNTFQKKWSWDLTELWRVWGRFILAQSMMEVWVFYCLYFRFCQGWYCSHDRIVNKKQALINFFDLMKMYSLQFLTECNSVALHSFWCLHSLIKTLKGTLCPICAPFKGVEEQLFAIVIG